LSLNTNSRIELTLRDSDLCEDEIPHLKIEEILETIQVDNPIPGTISAKCWSDDKHLIISFNSAAYFAQATPEEILELEQCDWAQDYPCDAVVRFFESSDSKVEKLFAYIRIAEIGFDCDIDRDSALAWLKTYRPELFGSTGPLRSLEI